MSSVKAAYLQKESLFKKVRKLFVFYIRHRLKSCIRILLALGVLRLLFLGCLLGGGLYLLYRHPSPYLLPTVCAALLFLYHSYRSDKDFLKVHLKCPEGIITGEYLLYTFPFLFISLLRGDWVTGIFYIGFALVLPYFPSFRFGSFYLPLPFLSPGSYEYARGIRRYGVFYVLLFIFSCVGGVYHQNTQIIRFSIICWGLCMWDFYILPPHEEEWLSYRKFNHLFIHKTGSILINSSLLYFPFLILLLIHGEGFLFFLTVWSATVLFLTGSSMIRYCCPQSRFLQFITSAVFLLPFYVLSFFSAYSLLILLLASAGITWLSYLSFQKNSCYVRNKRAV